MSFKDSYKKDNQNIIPDPQFKEDLLKNVQEMQSAEIIRRKKMAITVKICSSCAAVLVLITGITVFVRNHSETGKIQPGEKAGKNEITSVSSGMLTQKCWYDSDMSGQEIVTLFIDRLKNDKDLTCLYENDQNMFNEENLMDDRDIKALTDKISKARLCDDEPDDTSEIRYYMAQFKNNDIIKFSVYGDSYLKIKNIDSFFKF